MIFFKRLLLVPLLFIPLFLVTAAIYQIFKSSEVEQRWLEEEIVPFDDIQSVSEVKITPLVNWYTNNPDLKTEAGVSYLIEVDGTSLLFDVGFNSKKENPSPLEHNMHKLGVRVENIDYIYLSHHHLDHSGGQDWVRKGTFSLGNRQLDLSGKRIVSPVSIHYPETQIETIPTPTMLFQGVYSIGGIERQLTFGGIVEQALAINIDGKGMLLVVGCGHQTLKKILDRFDLLFPEQRLYGIVGDLHYPVPDGRLILMGLNAQRRLASGRGFWSPLTIEEVDADIGLLLDREISLIGLGAHDTSDEVLKMFRDVFGSAYASVFVGEPIVIKKDHEEAPPLM